MWQNYCAMIQRKFWKIIKNKSAKQKSAVAQALVIIKTRSNNEDGRMANFRSYFHICAVIIIHQLMRSINHLFYILLIFFSACSFFFSYLWPALCDATQSILKCAFRCRRRCSGFSFSTAYSTVHSATYCAAWRNGKMLLISRAEYLAQVAETIWRSMIENSFLYQATSYQQLLETLMNFSVQIKYAMYDSVLVRQ